MKATVVKSPADFQTVGFEVTSNGKTIFSWGVAPVMQLYFCKEVDTKDWETEIFRLIELRERLTQQETFVQYWFEAAAESGMDTDGFSMKHTRNDKRIAQTKREMKNIIDNIK